MGEGEGGRLPALDKVLERVAPLDLGFIAVSRLVLQLRQRLAHDVLDDVDESGARLHLGPVGREREPVLRDLQQRHAERPDVRVDGVGLPGDPFRRHVVRGSDESVRIPSRSELAAYAKVAQLDLPVPAQQDVRWLDV